MRVLVLGATGFVGYPVALAYVRAGHEVYGVTRSETKAKSLQAEEITPIVASSVAVWVPYLAFIDLLVDCSVTTGPNACYEIIEATAKAASERPDRFKLTYIFCSGTWSYGSSDEWKDERNGRFTGVGLTAWRPAVETAVVENKAFEGIVIRPGMVYGRSGSLIALLFDPATKAAQKNEGAFSWPATPGKRWGLIHQDDLAELFVRVGEAAPIAKHLTFDAVNAATDSVEDILIHVGKLVGVPKHEYTSPADAGPIYEGIDTQALTKPSLGRALLGWVPKKRSLVDGLPEYYKAWKASQA